MSAPAKSRGDGREVVGARAAAPLGSRSCQVVGNVASGGYRIVSALDSTAVEPRAGQFYMLRTGEGWGGGGERPYLPRAFSVARWDRSRDGVRLDFLLAAVGPGTARLAGLAEGEGLMITGPLGNTFSTPRQLNPDAAGAILVGGGIGAAPLAVLRRELSGRGIPVRTLLGFRDEAHSGGLDLFGCTELRLASEDGHAGHTGYVTELLSKLLTGDSSKTAAVYSCGPPGMLEAVRAMCAEREVPCELAMESPMACGYGACFGCAVPVAGGGYIRLCVDGPVVRGDRVETALVRGSGHG